MNLNLNVKTVIINVGTSNATTLALLSALRYTNWRAVATGVTVTKNVGDLDVVGGIPARKIGERNNEGKYKPIKPFFRVNEEN